MSFKQVRTEHKQALTSKLKIRVLNTQQIRTDSHQTCIIHEICLNYPSNSSMQQWCAQRVQQFSTMVENIEVSHPNHKTPPNSSKSSKCSKSKHNFKQIQENFEFSYLHWISCNFKSSKMGVCKGEGVTPPVSNA